MKGRTYRYFDDPLFAFGYGKSYTTFRIGTATTSTSNGKHILRIPVENTGKCDGTEVVQAYVRNPADVDGPLKSLRAFKRVTVKAGQTVEVELELTPQSFELFDTETNTMRTKPGRYEVFYGNSSRNQDLKKVEITL